MTKTLDEASKKIEKVMKKYPDLLCFIVSKDMTMEQLKKEWFE